MANIIHNHPQGSQEWLDARMGKITGTGFASVISTRGERRVKYMKEKAKEIKFGESEPHFYNEAMAWGTAHEDEARRIFEIIKGMRVVQVGFVKMNEHVGISPDGLLDGDKMVEIKCPASNTHRHTAATKKLPSQYKAQVQGSLWVLERVKCYFISYDPRVPECPIVIIPVERDEEYIKALEREVDKFVVELKEMVLEMKG